MKGGPTAMWPTRDLYASLGHAGWGVLDAVVPGVRKVLEALIYQLPYKTGEGRVTVAQISSWAHLGDRWTRKCLYQLEAMGVITWSRGYVLKGRAVPSIIRISKRALLQIIRHAREPHRAALEAKKRRDAERVRNIEFARRRHKRKTPSQPVEALSTYLTPYGGGNPEPPPPESLDNQGDDDMKTRCIHGMPDINGCGMCQMELRHNPKLNVTTLWAPKTQQRGDAARGREACRAAVRAAKHHQDPLTP